MQKRIVLKYISIICALILMVSGCGKKESEKEVKVENGKTLSLQMRLPDSLNPLEAKNLSVRDAFSLCYEPLFALNDLLEPEGVLARGIQISDDAQSAVVMLKEGIVWHDGVKFTSGDVIHTINLIKENSHCEYYDCVKYIESVQSIDPLSLKITLSRPYGQIAYSLTFPVVASHNDNLSEKIIGTGPYVLEKYLTSTRLEMKRFDKWHGGEVLCENAKVSVIRDRETATSAFNKEVINVTTSESFDSENATVRHNARSTMYPSCAYEFMAFNHSRKIFSSPSVRSAISSALDRSVIVKECYLGVADMANSPINPSAKEMVSSSLLSQYNLANAHEMLFFEGYSMEEKTRLLKNENGEKISFSLLVNSDNLSRMKAAETIRVQLFEAGIEVSVRALEFEDYEREIKNGNFDAYLGGTRIGNLYDFEFLFAEDGALNNYGYKSEYMNLALASLAAAATKDSLSNAVFNFEEVFSRETPVCGIAFCKDILITGEKVMGKLLPAPGYPYKNIAGWSVK